MLSALWLMVLASSSQVMIIAPILPRIGEALRIEESVQGYLITAYTLTMGATALVAGPVSDKFGRRFILLVGTGVQGIGLLLHVFAFDYYSLMTVRMVAGMGGGVLTGAAVSAVGDFFPYERRGWANGIVMSGFAVGQVLGVPAGTILAKYYGFRAPFSVFAGVMALSFLMTLVLVPQPEVERSDEPLSVGGALRNYGELFVNHGAVRVAAACYGLIFFSIQTFVAFMPTWLEDEFALHSETVASMFFFGGLASVVAGPQAGRLSDRVGRRPLIAIACVGTAALTVATTFAIRGAVSAHIVFFLTMVLLAGRLSPFQTLVSSLVPAHRRGTLMSGVVSVGQIGGGVGAAVAGIVYQHHSYFADTLLSATAILATAALVWWGLAQAEQEADRQTGRHEALVPPGNDAGASPPSASAEA